MNRTIAITAFMGMALAAAAVEGPRRPAGNGGQNGGARAAGCAPAQHFNELDLNNVRARIETGGNLWQNRSQGQAAYEVPKTENRNGPRSLFAGGLWMGGLDPGGNLKLAAVLFRQSGQNDFWPGPLDTTGQAGVEDFTCAAYDRSWKVHRSEVEAHVAYYRCVYDPNCDVATNFPNGYSIPTAFLDWPAHGDPQQGQSYSMAPWRGHPSVEEHNGEYNASAGDYPGYDLEGNNDCKNRFRENPVPLYGDQTIWWVFNDKGNIHTESGAQPIGMEVRAQAFAFATNDEINNMTFYNYVLFNRGSLTLRNAFFGQYADPDLGNGYDDYVGCDVQRGLGYCYNGDNNDETTGGGLGYGVQPPAIGIDFFEGPFQDADGRDNVLATDNCAAALLDSGIVYPGIGMGYGDDVIDNERFGMRAFLYYVNPGAPGSGAAPAATHDPNQPQHFYNYLNGIWKDNTPMTYGGIGYAPGSLSAVRTSYMFPGDSDPLAWATRCAPQAGIWNEQSAGNPPSDRRFVQSAGPFLLEPGAYNNITVGVVWARATTGGPYASVQAVKRADDKAQALFDNCFKVLDGPDAPIVRFQELDKEIILYLTYPETGTNNPYNDYVELDPTIPPTRSVQLVMDSVVVNQNGDTVRLPYYYEGPPVANDMFYRFQGFLVYQVRDASVSVDQLRNSDVARLVAQVDLKDTIRRLVNYPFDADAALPVPMLMVDGANEGVTHSFQIKEDKFAVGADPRLVNFKSYHFIAVAYASNQYMPYNPVTMAGQAFPFLMGRRSAGGGAIRSYTAIPHNPAPEAGGTVANTSYGDGFALTRLEGQGNGGNILELDQSSLDVIMSGPPYWQQAITYKPGAGPVEVKVVDPLRVPAGRFELWFTDTTAIPEPLPSHQNDGYMRLNDAEWMLVRLTDDPTSQDTVRSKHAIVNGAERLILDWGISVNIRQPLYDPPALPRIATVMQTGTYLGAAKTPANSWFVGIPDEDGETMFNWIRSGTIKSEGNTTVLYPDQANQWDEHQIYEDILGGTWAPWLLVGDTSQQPGPPKNSVVVPNQLFSTSATNPARLINLPSVQVVLTRDRSKWTRSVVMEAHADPARTVPANTPKLSYRPVPSVDKNGIPTGAPGCNEAEAQLTDAVGMGWFPGYAIDLETGERLNVAFSEDSFLGGAEGRDMLWNPSEYLEVNGAPVFGGGHWIYVMRNLQRTAGNSPEQMPGYDAGAFFRANMRGALGVRIRTWSAISWVGSALVAPGTQWRTPQDGLVPSDVSIRINVSRPYERLMDVYANFQPPVNTERNRGLPLYAFESAAQATYTNVHSVANEMLDAMSVVPNPYLAHSGYERNRLDNRVRFINLPERCNITIYNVAGTMVRRYRKDDTNTFLDWDLNNSYNVPIAGGTYICHIEVPGVGERVIKWFGVIRSMDMQNL